MRLHTELLYLPEPVPLRSPWVESPPLSSVFDDVVDCVGDGRFAAMALGDVV